MSLIRGRKRGVGAARALRGRLIKKQNNPASTDHPMWLKNRLDEVDAWIERRERAMEFKERERRDR